MSHAKSQLPEPTEFLDDQGRLPGFAQRRLDSLIAKKKSRQLTREESRELSEMLEYIDRKSIEMLKRRAKHHQLRTVS